MAWVDWYEIIQGYGFRLIFIHLMKALLSLDGCNAAFGWFVQNAYRRALAKRRYYIQIGSY